MGNIDIIGIVDTFCLVLMVPVLRPQNLEDDINMSAALTDGSTYSSAVSNHITNWHVEPWPSNACWSPLSCPVHTLVALRHSSVRTARNEKLRLQCGPDTHKKDAFGLPGTGMLASKSYFGNTGLERVPIATSGPSATVTQRQGAQVVLLAEALT
jgi:hypothetical protein